MLTDLGDALIAFAPSFKRRLVEQAHASVMLIILKRQLTCSKNAVANSDRRQLHWARVLLTSALLAPQASQQVGIILCDVADIAAHQLTMLAMACEVQDCAPCEALYEVTRSGDLCST
jgi:hypothetical protein